MAYVRTALTVKGIARITKMAREAYEIMPDRAIYVQPKVKATITDRQRFGLDNREQADSRRRRWAIAYRTACNLFGIPLDAVWIPCYGCERLADAWTLDADHVDANGMSDPGNLMLMCSDCNTHEKGSRAIHPNAEAAILAAGRPTGYVCGGPHLQNNMWCARPRRTAGGNFSQTRYLDI